MFSSTVPPFSFTVPTFSSTVPTFSSTVPTFSFTVPTFSSNVPTFSSTVPMFSYVERMSLAPSETYPEGEPALPGYLGNYQRIRHMSGFRQTFKLNGSGKTVTFSFYVL